MWGVHIWHDNSGPSPSWYLKQVRVCQVRATCLWMCCSSCVCVWTVSWPRWGFICVLLIQVSREHVMGRAWLFIGQCWLGVTKGDGRVERSLRVCTQRIGFAKVERSHSDTKNNTFNLFFHVTLGLHLCVHRCCVSSYLTTWPTTISGCLCAAVPVLAHSHTLKDLACACCLCWDMHVSAQ